MLSHAAARALRGVKPPSSLSSSLSLLLSRQQLLPFSTSTAARLGRSSSQFFNASGPGFGSGPGSGSGSGSLLQSLRKEIADEEENGEDGGPLPDVYEDFDIQTLAGSPVITLAKQFDEEDITVTVNLNNCSTPGEEDLEMGSSEAGGGVDNAPIPSFEVEIVKNDTALTLLVETVQLPGEEIQEFHPVITDISFGPVLDEARPSQLGLEKRDSQYFTDAQLLDEELLESWIDYLGARTIDAEFCTWLAGYIADKEYKEYKRFLRKAEQFVC